MSWSYKKTDRTEVHMNFVAPEGADLLNREVLFPLAQVQAPDYAATIAATIKQMQNFIQPAELTGNATLNLTINAQVTAGARLHLKLSADATARTLTLGTGFDAAAENIVVPANTTLFAAFEYDGTSFLPCSFDEVELGALAARMTAVEADIVALEGSEVLSPAYGATLAVTIEKKETFLQPAELTGNATINLTIGEAVPVGAKLHLKLDADATDRTVTLGTGFDAGLASIVVAATKVAFVTFTYNGTAFVPAYSVPATA
ncbi:MAG: hypothetical protein A2W90_14635 [Bacteroidetes bacterium GWF2_42_66]|nr:MAG: hypothetical protein A2W92_16030 [Bacteroidetes bacterium GWA2_42_15]OFX99069.1 MAG: hypothetical protein A2W89_06625 [Bacteroidetes bacterium GWE2_42_39]OFY46762.1 MAG: hypothetical protein A2W90_14635 [Bacteroidetes bacterium GWF2_42_66]HBL73830.1 hypothetical protein [Prolixibacteraceae bacterium]HCR89503.1 hypothetical protein [Prolixibacteraceae bacterium]